MTDTPRDERPPRTAKESAVRQWRDAIDEAEQLGEGEAVDRLRDLDIHDARDRREIEETVEYDIDSDVAYLGLHDAFHDLRQTFDDVWQ